MREKIKAKILYEDGIASNNLPDIVRYILALDIEEEDDDQR